MVTRNDYTADAVEAARSVLVELVHLLGEYRDDIVLIGGCIPEILLSREDRPHVGSMDVDLALNHRNLEEEGYRNIRDLLLKRGYQQGKQPFIFYRNVDVKSNKMNVQIDLLAGEYEGTGKSHRHQKTQGVFARKVRGCDLAFEMNVEVTIEGILPGGGKDSVSLRVAFLVAHFGNTVAFECRRAVSSSFRSLRRTTKGTPQLRSLTRPPFDPLGASPYFRKGPLSSFSNHERDGIG